MNIRNYQKSDEEELIQLWWDSWHSSSIFPHPKPIDEWRKRWQDLLQSHIVAVAVQECEIVGFAALNQTECELSQIFVSVRHKRQGIGTLLFSWALSHCNGPMNLKTLKENKESRAFYEKHGMRICGESINDFNQQAVIEYTL